METARPFAPETRSRDRLWFGFRPDSRSDRGGPPAFRPDRPSADQGRGPPDRLVGTEAAARVSCGEPITAFRTANSPTEIKRRGVEMRLIIEGLSAAPRNADPVLLKEIRRAHRCFEALVSGQVGSVAELATLEEISDRYVSSVLPLAFLAPDIVEAIAAGRQPPDLTAHRLIRAVELPIVWSAQNSCSGFLRRGANPLPKPHFA